MAALVTASSSENARIIFTEILEQEGLGGRSDLMDYAMQGYADARPPKDTLFTVMEAYATTIIQFHDELLRFEGGFVVDPASGELALSGTDPPDALLALEESVGILATEMLERQERAVTVMESQVNSLRRLAR